MITLHFGQIVTKFFMYKITGSSSRTAFVLCLGICAVLLLCAIKLRSYPSTEWDEGAYLTTFQTIQRGFLPYKQTYLSQPPGFFVTVYPLFTMLGSNLESARLGVFFYSLVGLAAIVWVGWELRSVVFGFIAIGILYLIPIYNAQIMTFHADSLPSTFSTLAFASTLRYRNSNKLIWLILSAIFIAIAILIKVDVSVLPTIGLVLLAGIFQKAKKIGQLVKEISIFGFAALVFMVLILLPFGIKSVLDNVLQLRVQAAAVFPHDINTFFAFFEQEPPLTLFTIAGVLLGIIAFYRIKQARFFLLLLFSWVLSTFILLLIYHPLMQHHIVLLSIPITLFLAYSIYMLGNISQPKITNVAVPIFVAIVLVSRISYALAQPEGIPTPLELEGIKLIQTNTSPGDYVISDDGLLAAFTNRATPPGLVDISSVRIRSGNLTIDEFRHNLDTYQPKMILEWVDKLITMPDLDETLKQYHYNLIKDIDGHYRAYLLQPPN